MTAATRVRPADGWRPARAGGTLARDLADEAQRRPAIGTGHGSDLGLRCSVALTFNRNWLDGFADFVLSSRGIPGTWWRARATTTHRDVMRVREVATTVRSRAAHCRYRLAANGERPGFKVDGIWRLRWIGVDRRTEAIAVSAVEEIAQVVGKR